jgi:hypothetical protein
MALRLSHTRQKPRQLEHHEQVALIDWCARMSPRYPELAELFAVPNAGGYSGGFKANVARVQRLKSEGVRSGEPDLLLLVPRSGYHGLCIEMKAGTGRVSPEQSARHEQLKQHGYRVMVCYSWQFAATVLLEYLTGCVHEWRGERLVRAA